jgi:hypothetical protein
MSIQQGPKAIEAHVRRALQGASTKFIASRDARNT